MTVHLSQNRPASLDFVLRTDDAARQYPLRAGLSPDDVDCQVKRAGAPAWQPKALTPTTFRDVGHGAYVIALEAAELDTVGALLVLLTGHAGLAPALLPSLAMLDVVLARELHAARPDLDRTILTGQVAGLDGRPLQNATVTATLLEVPVLLGGVAIAGDVVIASCDGDGFFELPLLSGATVDVQIPAARYRRTLVVPFPPAPGAPVRLFAIA